jgi:hypothetical protein
MNTLLRGQVHLSVCYGSITETTQRMSLKFGIYGLY